MVYQIYYKENEMPTIICDGKNSFERIKMGEATLVRTFSAGIHFGLVKKRKGKEVTLVNARRLWSWAGACSLSQIAVNGVDLDGSRISVAVPEIILTEVIELIPMTKKASKQMMEAKPWKK
jgi:hypothetical protein